MKNNIHLWQIEVVAWRPDLNLKEILKSIKNTPSWDLLILPEMAIPGYMIWDKWKSNSFIKECFEMNQDILDELKINWNSAIWWNISFDENGLAKVDFSYEDMYDSDIIKTDGLEKLIEEYNSTYDMALDKEQEYLWVFLKWFKDWYNKLPIELESLKVKYDIEWKEKFNRVVFKFLKLVKC